MPWECDNKVAQPGALQVWRNTFVADGSGAFTAETIPNLQGQIQRIEWVPGATTPDSSVTMTAINDQGVDILAEDSAGATLDMTAAGTATPRDPNGNEILYPVRGGLTIGIEDNGTGDAVVTVLVYIIHG